MTNTHVWELHTWSLFTLFIFLVLYCRYTKQTGPNGRVIYHRERKWLLIYNCTLLTLFHFGPFIFFVCSHIELSLIVFCNQYAIDILHFPNTWTAIIAMPLKVSSNYFCRLWCLSDLLQTNATQSNGFATQGVIHVVMIGLYASNYYSINWKAKYIFT